MGCQSTAQSSPAGEASGTASRPTTAVDLKGGTHLAPAPAAGLEVATFAGGCFWCMEPPFEKVAGVLSAESGYTGGSELHPSYKQVSYGKTSHTESVWVVFDPKVVSYDKLLDVFWRSMDPTDLGGQFVDRGEHYRPGIFVHSEAQKQAALKSKAALEADGPFKKKIVVPIAPASAFWLAEDYHQDFYKKDPSHYKRYRSGSGRSRFLKARWPAAK
jgi:methionine-S-sulfoxide reductase